MKTARILVAVCCLLIPPAMTDDDPIIVGETAIVNDYPEKVTFSVEASSTAADINSVDLHITVRGDSSTAVYVAEFTPGQLVKASAEWRTRFESIPPGVPAEYSWVIKDEAGNTFETEPAAYIVTDARFTWQTLESEDVALWWYAGDEAFGQRVFDAAARALEAMEQNTGLSPSYRVHVVLYENREDFDSWHYYPRDWVGGEAFVENGLTVQIVPPGDEKDTYWYIQGMIPHEVAHLFFHQITYNPLSGYPHTWLNEGFAQYHEFRSHETDLKWVRHAAQKGELIPLRLASGSFSGDDERIRLLYAESLSAVTFLLERWGEAGVGRLLAAFKEDYTDTNEALFRATGLYFEEFQEAWWEWLGGEPGLYPTPPPSAGVATPRPAELRPTVPPGPTPSPTPHQTPGPTPVATTEALGPTKNRFPWWLVALQAGVLLIGIAFILWVVHRLARRTSGSTTGLGRAGFGWISAVLAVAAIGLLAFALTRLRPTTLPQDYYKVGEQHVQKLLNDEVTKEGHCTKTVSEVGRPDAQTVELAVSVACDEAYWSVHLDDSWRSTCDIYTGRCTTTDPTDQAHGDFTGETERITVMGHAVEALVWTASYTRTADSEGVWEWSCSLTSYRHPRFRFSTLASESICTLTNSDGTWQTMYRTDTIDTNLPLR